MKLEYEGRCQFCRRDIGAGHGPYCPYRRPAWRLLVGLALWLLLAPPALGQTVKVQPKLEGTAYRLLSISVESDGKVTRWVASDGLDIFR